jgi:hypothetical protein
MTCSICLRATILYKQQFLLGKKCSHWFLISFVSKKIPCTVFIPRTPLPRRHPRVVTPRQALVALRFRGQLRIGRQETPETRRAWQAGQSLDVIKRRKKDICLCLVCTWETHVSFFPKQCDHTEGFLR